MRALKNRGIPRHPLGLRFVLALACAIGLALAWLRRLVAEDDRPLGDGSEPWLVDLARRRDGTITAVVPCYNQREFIAETLRSLASQSLPPASIIVVDDASPDGCAAEAERVLLELRPQRDAQRAALGVWLNFSSEAYADQVLRVDPPSRGVAAARNRALSRVSSEWVCCVDADDLLKPSYFELAMREVSADPALNLVFANQQFFGESDWRWDVPEWSPQGAVASGPLPVSTLLRHSLWAATPYGFDEAQPRGHEDWSLWLQLVRLPVRARKLPQRLLLYRFRSSSKKRTREARNPEVVRLLRTLYADLYPARALLDDHAQLLASGLTAEVLADARATRVRSPARGVPALWLGMQHEHEGDLVAAAREYTAAAELRAQYDWQPLLRLACITARLSDAVTNARACRSLIDLWGPEQAGWYLQPSIPPSRSNHASAGDGADGEAGRSPGSCCASHLHAASASEGIGTKFKH